MRMVEKGTWKGAAAVRVASNRENSLKFLFNF